MTLLDWWVVGLGVVGVVLLIVDEVVCRRRNARLLASARLRRWRS